METKTKIHFISILLTFWCFATTFKVFKKNLWI